MRSELNGTSFDLGAARLSTVVPKLEGVEWLANRLGVPKSWVATRCRSRSKDKPPFLKLGKYVRFNPDDPALLRWIASHSRESR
jgi:hypothetical protein